MKTILKSLKRVLRNNLKSVKKSINEFQIKIKVRGKQKVFCIGQNKTGTTSLIRAFQDLGFVVGNQEKAERLIDNYGQGNFRPFIKYCATAQVFQDFPFSYPETFIVMDKEFPGSKFILSVRDNPEQWYNSYVGFLSRVSGRGKLPTFEDLSTNPYLWNGWFWKSVHFLFKTPKEDPFNKEMLINHYITYNERVLEYFKNRPEDLIVINLSKKGDYKRMIDFLGVDSPFEDFPWVNKTERVPIRHW